MKQGKLGQGGHELELEEIEMERNNKCVVFNVM